MILPLQPSQSISKRLFRKTIDTGLEHGTVTVLIDGVGYEVTTYRIEGKYETIADQQKWCLPAL